MQEVHFQHFGFLKDVGTILRTEVLVASNTVHAEYLVTDLAFTGVHHYLMTCNARHVF
jgi:hypothetical protein